MNVMRLHGFLCHVYYADPLAFNEVLMYGEIESRRLFAEVICRIIKIDRNMITKKKNVNSTLDIVKVKKKS